MQGESLPEAVVRWALQIPIPKDCEAAWAEVEKANLGDRQRVALRLVAAGMRVTAAAAAVGLAHHADLSRNLSRFGFEPPDRQTLGREFRRIAGLSMHEWQRRLEENPEKVPMNQIQIGAGIAVDKVARAEGWETKHETNQDAQVRRFLDRISNVRPVSLQVVEAPAIDAEGG
jgi:hypothetical protein